MKLTDINKLTNEELKSYKENMDKIYNDLQSKRQDCWVAGLEENEKKHYRRWINDYLYGGVPWRNQSATFSYTRKNWDIVPLTGVSYSSERGTDDALNTERGRARRRQHSFQDCSGRHGRARRRERGRARRRHHNFQDCSGRQDRPTANEYT